MLPTRAVPRTQTRPTVAQWVFTVALVVGVLGMHALLGPAAGTTATAAGTTATAAMATMTTPAAAAAAGTVSHHPATGCGHAALNPCLAVLAPLIALGALTLLAVSTGRWGATATAADRPGLACRLPPNRPPPWTVPSLHQLALLRV